MIHNTLRSVCLSMRQTRHTENTKGSSQEIGDLLRKDLATLLTPELQDSWRDATLPDCMGVLRMLEALELLKVTLTFMVG